MALDISGFLVPEQKYEGLYKIGDALAAKDAAKAKAAEVAKANKAALLKIPETQFNTKDYLSGTIADPNITNRLFTGLQQVNSFIEQNPGASQAQVNSIAFPIVSQIAQDSEKSKVLKRQMEAGVEQVKGIKGANVDKFIESFQNRAWGIQNKVMPDNLNNVDITHNYVNDVLNNDDIYNLDVAVGEDIKNMGKSSEMKDVLVRDAKGNITKAKKKIQTSSSFVPDIDAQGVFQGVVPEHTVAPASDATKSISKYISGDPNKELRLVSDDEFNRMRYNLGVMGAINAETKKYAQAIGRVPTPEEILAFQKAKLFDVYSNNAKVGFAHEDVQETKAPLPPKLTVNVGGAGAAGDENEYTGNVFDEIDLSQYTKENNKPLLLNNKIITLKQGVAAYEDGTPVSKGVIKVEASDLPVSIEQLIKATYPKYPLKDFAYLTIKDGEITDVQYSDSDPSGTPVDKSPKISRQNIENFQTGQKKKLTKKKNVGGVKFGKKVTDPELMKKLESE